MHMFALDIDLPFFLLFLQPCHFSKDMNEFTHMVTAVTPLVVLRPPRLSFSLTSVEGSIDSVRTCALHRTHRTGALGSFAQC